MEAVRKAIGDGMLLMVDANQKWDLMQATRAAQLLEGLVLAWLEEPLHPDDIRSHRLLSERTSIPIALGEHVYTTHGFRDYIESNAVGWSRWTCAGSAASRRGSKSRHSPMRSTSVCAHTRAT